MKLKMECHLLDPEIILWLLFSPDGMPFIGSRNNFGTKGVLKTFLFCFVSADGMPFI